MELRLLAGEDGRAIMLATQYGHIIQHIEFDDDRRYAGLPICH